VVDAFERRFVVAELGPPIRIRPPRRRLEDEARLVPCGDLQVRGVVAPDGSPTVLRIEEILALNITEKLIKIF
jgi:hypothetical protein